MKKSSIKRISIICQGLNWKPMTKKEIQDHIWDKLQSSSSSSCIEKDIYLLRNEFDAPIKYNRINHKYEIYEEFDFISSLTQYLNI
jgi:hypothetical protein